MCRRAEKNSELSQTSKMKLLEKIVKRFKGNTYFCNNLHFRGLTGFEYTSEEYLLWKYPENLLAGICKVTDNKTLISMKQGSTREKI